MTREEAGFGVRLFSFLPLFLFAAHAGAAAGKIDPRACAECHGGPDAKALADSVHGGLECVDCHAAGPFKAHAEAPERARCSACHEGRAEEFARSAHGRARAAGIADAPDCDGCHGDPHLIQAASEDPEAPHGRKNSPLTCSRCHADVALTKKYDIPARDALEAYRRSVHGRAHFAGNLEAAVCSDCHGAHAILPGHEMGSASAKQKIPQTCGRCHEKILEEYNVSVHGRAAARGRPKAPVCTDCHGEHGILEPKDPDSPVSPVGLLTKSCGHCHADLSLAESYGFAPARISSYRRSYHGLAVRRGALTVADCGSCHGTHRILPSTDPESSIHPENLAATCGRCHPGATEAFAKVPVHLQTSPTQAPVLHYVRLAYIWLIVATIGLMLLHNLLIYASAVVTKLRRERAGKRYRRFTTAQLVMHGLLLTSFAALVVTGFGLHYPDAEWTKLLGWLGMNEEGRRWIHRIAACVMLATGLWHVLHTFLTKQGRYDAKELLPKFSDVRELRKLLLYYVSQLRGRPAQYPKMGRYSYIHKAEYWALVWGTIVMAVTGFSLWFPVVVSRWLPPWGIPLMNMIHFYEAWLATLAILVWHWFFVIFHPQEYPMSVTWLTGHVTEEEMRHEHPQELKVQEGERGRTA